MQVVKQKKELVVTVVVTVFSVSMMLYSIVKDDGKPLLESKSTAMVGANAGEEFIHNGSDNGATTMPYVPSADLEGVKLPESLRDVDLEFNLAELMGSDGHLILSSDLKTVFDFFLSGVSEESLEIIVARINAYLEQHLEGVAIDEAKIALSQYIALKSSLVSFEAEMADVFASLSESGRSKPEAYVDFLRHQLDRRNELRDLHMETELRAAFFADEEQYDEYTYDKLRINASSNMSSEQKLIALEAARDVLPKHVQLSMQRTQIADELQLRTRTVIESGGDHEQVRQVRLDMFGVEAQQRFDELDSARALWDQRLSSYLVQRRAIESNRGLSADDIAAEIRLLRESLFTAQEHVRVRALETREGLREV